MPIDFIEKNELYCLYVWLRIRFDNRLVKMINSITLPSGSDHNQRLLVVYWYFDIMPLDDKDFNYGNYDPTIPAYRLINYLRNECSLIFNNQSLFNRIYKDKALSDFIWENYFFCSNFKIRKINFSAYINVYETDYWGENITQYIPIFDIKQRNILMHAMHYAADKKYRDIQLKKITRMLQTQRYRKNKRHDGKKLIQATICEETKKILLEYMRCNGMTLSQVLTKIIVSNKNKNIFDFVIFEKTKQVQAYVDHNTYIILKQIIQDSGLTTALVMNNMIYSYCNRGNLKKISQTTQIELDY